MRAHAFIVAALALTACVATTSAVAGPRMDARTFATLAETCAPRVDRLTLEALVRTESAYNPYAIGVVGGRLVRQPATLEEAVATARSLERQGYNFSVGLGQVNRYNLARFGETIETAFDACRNLRAGGTILAECFARSLPRYGDQQQALRAALSCYYSGNFETGFRHGYVQKVVANAGDVPAIAPSGGGGRIEPIPVVPAGGGTPSPAPRAAWPTSASAQPRLLSGSACTGQNSRQVMIIACNRADGTSCLRCVALPR
jgi:type IV secretion system protein VirB1